MTGDSAGSEQQRKSKPMRLEAVVESVGAAGDDADLAVETFGATVGDAGADIGTDALDVPADRSCGFDEGGELGAGCPLRAIL
jgi:hypothetical protein